MLSKPVHSSIRSPGLSASQTSEQLLPALVDRATLTSTSCRISGMGPTLKFATTAPLTGWTRYALLQLTTVEDRNGKRIDTHRHATGRPRRAPCRFRRATVRRARAPTPLAEAAVHLPLG